MKINKNDMWVVKFIRQRFVCFSSFFFKALLLMNIKKITTSPVPPPLYEPMIVFVVLEKHSKWLRNILLLKGRHVFVPRARDHTTGG
jgi:hypothetical protein